MVGKVVGHAVGGVVGEMLELLLEFSQFDLEGLRAHGARVLEITMPLVRDGVHVRQDYAQGPLASFGFGVLFAREPAEEVGRTIVAFVRD